MKVESAINLQGMVFTIGTTPNEIMFKKGEQFCSGAAIKRDVESRLHRQRKSKSTPVAS